jgi:GT2 family glycosyltransferase
MTADPDTDLSIIIVNWNTREMTLACLRSVYAQTRATAFEVILVDNGSHDGSAEAIAAEFPQVRLLAETVNHGFAVANNIAAKVARGRLLLLLNSDTVVLEGAIDTLVAFARAHPDAGIWGGRHVFADGSLNSTSAWRALSLWSVLCFALGLTILFRRSNLFNYEAMGGWRRDTERRVDIVTGAFLLIDANLWRRLDGFAAEFFMYGEETDLCARARAIGSRPFTTPAATIIHYGGGSTAVRSDAFIRILDAKIKVARRTLNGISAEVVRWLFLLAVVNRAVGYGLIALVNNSAGKAARQWREVLRRRAEWLRR